MISRLQQTRDDTTGFLYEDDVSKALHEVVKDGGVLCLPIAAQNAGVVVSRTGDDDPLVETFELSPPHGPVTSTKGRLTRSFPGPAFFVDTPTARHGDFQRAVAQVLAQMSCQDTADVKARTRRTRRGDDSSDDKDTKDPVLVTELLANMFMAAGKPADIPSITKNTRDEAMWSGTGRPWRRSSMYLLLRLSLQSFFVRSTGNDDLYKCFMVYYLASLVRSFAVDQLDTDILHVLVSKLQRRVSKLGDKTVREHAWLQSVTVTVKSTTELISRRWEGVQRTDRRPYGEWLSSLKTVDLDKDTRLLLPELEQYLSDLRTGDTSNNKTDFVPDPSRRLPLFLPDTLPVLDDTLPADYHHFQLLALEAWVQNHMGPWIQATKDRPDTCRALFKCMKEYHKAAQDEYAGNPECLSHMVLTLMELWAACDMAATAQCTLLQDYDHELPGQVLQALLLPRGAQMHRLARMEAYLHNRSEEASCQSSVFRSFCTDSSFGVRYFDESPHHQALRKEIEKHARHERRQKIEELAAKTKEYHHLQRLASTTRCDYVRRNDGYGNAEQVHHPECRRHNFVKAAENLQIDVHEWPLPDDELEAKSTVFELQVPKTVSAWRDATLYVTHDVLGSIVNDPTSLDTDYSPRVYTGLRGWFKGGTHRLGLRSTTKPYVVTNGKSVALADAPTQEDVCVPNGLQYIYFDTVLGIVSDAPDPTDKLTDGCTYALPETSASLQKFLRRTWSAPHGCPPNEALADQYACPEHMNLDAFKALASLPLGLNIQWQNVLVQLSMPAVEFRQMETCLFVLQVVYQAGPPGRGDWAARRGHVVLHDEAFVGALLDAVFDTHARIKDNWMAHLTLGILVWVTTRVLSVSTDEEARLRCISFLADARQTAVAWTRLLSERASSSTRDDEREQFRGQALDVALVCISSFDVDGNVFESLAAEDVAILLECSMLVQEKKPTTIDSSDTLKVLLLARWRHIMYEHRERLQTSSTTIANPLDKAISQSWTTHQPGPQWQPLPQPHQHLLVSTGDNDDVPTLHFNLLTAEFLVNGSPLARLPPDYEAHPLYQVLFGNTALEVMPSTEPGLRFAGKTLYHGHQLQFALREGDLTVRATDHDGRVWFLLPPRLFHNYFPTSFVEEHVHWVDLDKDTVEFRPIDRPWLSAAQLWTLSSVDSDRRLSKSDGSSLANIHSKTASILHQTLNPLEDALNIHIVHVPSTNSLEIELPRLGISFLLAAGSDLLECRQFRDYAVATSQDVGTLVGLQSKLVVEHKLSAKKMVLIPGGQIEFKTTSGHTSVSVVHGTADRVQAYEIDDLLGSVVDNGDLPSKVLLCYLHALTSHCLPDRLTGHTGTEQALSILESASLLSFGRLDRTSIDLLAKIAALSPARHYYPSHLTMAQSVDWNSKLGFLAQHGGLFTAVDHIFQEYETSLIFYPEDAPFFNETWDSLRKTVDRDLVERDLVMSSFLRLSGFGAEASLTRQDRQYSGRDAQLTDPERTARVYTAARLAMSQYPAGHIPLPPNTDLSSTLFRLLRGSSARESTQGPDASLGDKCIGYDAAWLKNMAVLFIRHWCRVHKLLASGSVDRYTFGVWLATLAYNSSADMQALQTLWVVFSQPAVGVSCAPPPRTSFNLFVGKEPVRSDLLDVVNNALRPFSSYSSPEAKTMAGASLDLQRRTYETARLQKRDQFINSLLAAWPTSLPPTPSDTNYHEYINTLEAMEGVVPLFRLWHDNILFGEYLDGLARGVQRCRVLPVTPPDVSPPAENWPSRDSGYAFVPLKSVFQSPVVVLRPRLVSSYINDIQPRPLPAVQNSTSSDDHLDKLSSMFERLHVQAQSDNERTYVDKLGDSLQSLQKYEAASRRSGRWRQAGSSTAVVHAPDLKYRLQKHLKACRENVDTLYKNLVRSYKMALPGLRQFPRLSPTVFLSQLCTRRWTFLSTEWKTAIVDYALALVALHRATRLLSLSGPAHEAEFNKELANVGHTNWSPTEHPEWLLLEVESGITIRAVQRDIAAHMSSSEKGNVVMQLNMGEGKSSVIVPMVASSLADGDSLVRVLVAKAQSKQALEMLVAKTSGLLGRRIYHFPFARPVHLSSPADILRVDKMLRDCQTQRGILLVQPEHILSFKLMGIERCMNGQTDDGIGKAMLATQHYLDHVSRDIVDESDEIFSAKFELIYTMGTQRPTELSPTRWGLLQELMDIVGVAVAQLKKEMPDAVEIFVEDTRWTGRFPRTRLLKKTAYPRLVQLVGRQLCQRGLHGFPIALQPAPIRQAVFRYLTKLHLTDEEVAAVETSSFWTDTTKGPLLLLRGLLAGGILSFALGAKRWRVNYGPAPANRQPPTQLVVPYQSKDMPSPRAEFSHPDVVLLLTSLHYYYAGLSDEALFASLHRLVNTDQPEDEYTAWVKTARSDMPPSFRQLSGVSLADRWQCTDRLFPFLKYSKGAIDYYLAHIVFPAHMKEFPDKISASGWDLSTSTTVTTGFSGTNDARPLLPLSVTQLDLPQQSHTNALVLANLLREENGVHLLEETGAEALLDAVVSMHPPVRVLLDVGAQVLELSNLQAAQRWLSKVEAAEAVVFFDDDLLSVVDRRGRVEPLQASPYAKHLDVCLVFLDEAHTRGTDLRLPTHYRAAVTLGADLTKDRLVQACMRMRQLGQGQSVVFLCQPEIQEKIQSLRPDVTTPTVSEVLSWAIHETQQELFRYMPLWALHGRRFAWQQSLWKGATKTDGYALTNDEAGKFREVEAQSLAQRYLPRNSRQYAADGEHNAGLADASTLQAIDDRCRAFLRDDTDTAHASLNEEQERELAPEIEEERQKARPPQATALKHSVHPDILYFIKTGDIRQDSEAFMPAFHTLGETSIANLVDLNRLSSQPLATLDFARTVRPDGTNWMDAFQRAPQYILTSSVSSSIDHLILVSPFEANEVFSYIHRKRASPAVRLHLYSARVNMAYRPLDRLELYTVGSQASALLPREVSISLNLLAGQLYFDSYQEYADTATFLGMAHRISDASAASSSSAGSSAFFKALMTQLRRQSASIDKTHVGKLLDGVLLTEEDFAVDTVGTY
ncbi:hypothetical protein Sste5346_006116 [Sporothrix stenoceras]|uniref:ubiquitinyl hydrolase 1 n=1 Tax=Sporothrix stenoceras TaxID=5173 RepID=A0ABR3Z0Y8_9PEZI